MKKITYRSKAESVLAEWFKRNGIKAEYESKKYKYRTKVYSGICGACEGKEVYQRRVYLLDFWLPALEFGIELKGLFNGSARTKMKAVKECNPEADIRLVFLANNKINPRSETRYLDWAEEHGYKAAIKVPDGRWFQN